MCFNNESATIELKPVQMIKKDTFSHNYFKLECFGIIKATKEINKEMQLNLNHALLKCTKALLKITFRKANYTVDCLPYHIQTIIVLQQMK